MRAPRVLAIGLLIVLASGFGMRAVASRAHMPPTSVLRGWACAGKERWKIKTLLDDRASDVNKTATTKTVEELRANTTRPENVSSKATRIFPVEFRRFRVHATIDEAFREGDGDLHVVMHDRANDGTAAEVDTMIAEFPDATCAPQDGSTYVTEMGNARDAFKNLVKRCTGYEGNFGSDRVLHLHATITGVGFWDVERPPFVLPSHSSAPNPRQLGVWQEGRDVSQLWRRAAPSGWSAVKRRRARRTDATHAGEDPDCRRQLSNICEAT